ncbi:MAG: IS21-like element helper ATPase IstB, partial [Deltaproteobacteria bacterium]|nr:IS21-like element helper ATPase IstB [Deltaproteobacteria bacterium]
MTPAELDLDGLLKRLHLAHMRKLYRDVAVRAETEQWSHRDFLAVLAAEEVALRQQTGIQKRTRDAHFPFLKTIEDYDFSLRTNVRLTLFGSFLSPDFITDGRSLILYGRTGRGKTHLAIAIAYKAILNGYHALFVTCAGLIETLSAAGREGRLQPALHSLTSVDVLVIDEVGYLTYGPDAANVLFHVVQARHLHRKPIIFTTNKLPRDWGTVLHDHDLAEAIVDRALDRGGRFVHLDGPSGRTGHLDPGMASMVSLTHDRIIGKTATEFLDSARASVGRP